MICAWSNIDIIDKKNPVVIEWTPVYKGSPLNLIIEYKKKELPNYICRVNDYLHIVTKDAGAWRIVVAALNPKNGKLFSIKWDDLEIDQDTIPFEL